MEQTRTIDNHPIHYIVATGEPEAPDGDVVYNHAEYATLHDAEQEFARRQTLITNTGWTDKFEVLMFKLVKVYPTQ